MSLPKVQGSAKLVQWLLWKLSGLQKKEIQGGKTLDNPELHNL